MSIKLQASLTSGNHPKFAPIVLALDSASWPGDHAGWSARPTHIGVAISVDLRRAEGQFDTPCSSAVGKANLMIADASGSDC
jgi:hypothetical protein